MTDKEVKEESLLPSVGDLINKYKDDDDELEHENQICIDLKAVIKYAMEITRKVTVLEMKNAIVNSDTYQVDDSFVIYVDVACNAMDIAENSLKLKIH